MNVLDLLNSGSAELKNYNISSYKLDSELLLSKVLEKKREEILINLGQRISPNKIVIFEELIKRRCKKEPLAYIFGNKEFWSKLFEVNRDTLIPRPETELMVEEIINIYKKKQITILDIGTGSGCVLISLLSDLEKSKGFGVDISEKAIKIAKKNAKRHKIANRIKFFNRSFTELHNLKFDLIVSNPPYIEKGLIKKLDDDVKNFEPKIALDGGNDGLDVIKKVIYKTKEFLKINGTLAIEIGNGQYKKVSKILNKNNFRVFNIIKDYKNNIRCLFATFYNK